MWLTDKRNYDNILVFKNISFYKYLNDARNILQKTNDTQQTTHNKRHTTDDTQQTTNIRQQIQPHLIY